MSDPILRQAQAFKALHVAGRPLLLHNVWDPGSARAVVAAGALAVATGSWSVAAAHGFEDGEQLPLELALANIARIVRAVPEVPVSMDLESGYGATPEQVGETISSAISAGVVGCNLEDSEPASGALRPVQAQAARLAAARQAADSMAVPLFLNARCDVFFQGPPETHDEAMVAAALERAHAYAAAGADGVFVPGLIDLRLIDIFTRAAPLPVNIMASSQTPSLAQLASAGVARISHGPGPYRAILALLQRLVRDDRGGTPP